MIIKLFYEDKFEGCDVVLKETRDQKLYYLIPLPYKEKSFNYNGETCHVRSQHLSIYEEQAKSEKHGLSSLHLTLICSSRSNQYTVHVYFDRFGNFVETRIEDKNLGVRIKKDHLQIRNYANELVGEKVLTLTKRAEEESQKQIELYEMFIEKAHKTSREIDFNNLPKSQKSVSLWVRMMETARGILNKINLISPTQVLQSPSLITDMIESMQQAMRSQEEQKAHRVKSLKKQQSPKKLSIVRATKPRQADGVAKEKKIKKYREEIDALNDKHDPASLVKRQSLLMKLIGVVPCQAQSNLLVELLENQNTASEQYLHALKENNLADVKILYPFAKTKANIGLYFELAQKGCNDTLLFLLDHEGFNINTNDPSYLPGANTLITIALVTDNFPLFGSLLGRGAAPDTWIPLKCATILMYATKLGKTPFVAELLKYKDKFDIYEVNEFREFFCLSTQHIRREEIEAIIKRENPRGEDALFYSMLSPQPELIELLLAHGYDVHRMNLDGKSVFGVAAMNTSKKYPIEVLKQLLPFVRDIDEVMGPSKFKNTALAYNCMHRRLPFISLLLEHGANPNLACIDRNIALSITSGKLPQLKIPRWLSPLHIAVIKNYPNVVRLLQAKSQLEGKNVKAAIQLAKIFGRVEIGKLFGVEINAKESIANASTSEERWKHIP